MLNERWSESGVGMENLSHWSSGGSGARALPLSDAVRRGERTRSIFDEIEPARLSFSFVSPCFLSPFALCVVPPGGAGPRLTLRCDRRSLEPFPLVREFERVSLRTHTERQPLSRRPNETLCRSFT